MVVIVVSDLRPQMVAAVLQLKARYQDTNCRVLMSEASILQCDFGQSDKHESRKLKARILARFFGVEIIGTSTDGYFDGDLTGVISSLISITNDSLADDTNYPELWSGLLSLHYGACNVISELQKSIPIHRLVIFNGRLASSHAIAAYAHQQGIDTHYYEYGAGFNTFQLTDFPTHDLARWGRELLLFADSKQIEASEVNRLAVQYRKTKLENVYGTCEKVVSRYDVAIFLSSSHEYKALTGSLSNFVPLTEVEFVNKVVQKYGKEKKYCVRCHPNHKNDPSFRVVLSEVQDLCHRLSIDFFDPESQISSHQLIENSGVVAVDISSIAIDALFLGRDVDFFGESTGSVIYTELIKRYPVNRVAEEMSKVLVLREHLFQNQIGISAMIVGVLFAFITDGIKAKLKNSFSLLLRRKLPR